MRIGLYVFLTVTYAMTLNRFGLAEWKITDSTSPHIHRSQSLTFIAKSFQRSGWHDLVAESTHTKHKRYQRNAFHTRSLCQEKATKKNPSTNLRLLSLGLRTLLCGRPYKGQDFGIPQPESTLTLVSVINRRPTGVHG